MDVRIEHLFEGISVADYVELYFDEAFNAAVGRALHMGRKLVRFDRTVDRIVRQVCYEPHHDPESPAKQAFGSSRASFVEELDFDVRANRGAWRTIPNLFADRVRNAGTIAFAEDTAGTRRTVDGEVKVRLFGFGGRVERMIVAEIVKSYDATTAFTRAWLAKR